MQYSTICSKQNHSAGRRPMEFSVLTTILHPAQNVCITSLGLRKETVYLFQKQLPSRWVEYWLDMNGSPSRLVCLSQYQTWGRWLSGPRILDTSHLSWSFCCTCWVWLEEGLSSPTDYTALQYSCCIMKLCSELFLSEWNYSSRLGSGWES